MRPSPALVDPVTIPAEKGRTLVLALAYVAAGAGALSLIGMFWNVRQFAYSYLTAFAFLASLVAGALFWVMIHHLTGAGWSVVVRRLFENLAGLAPWLLAFAVPFFVVLAWLYDWNDAAKYASDPMWRAKRGWLNVPFFIARALVYLATWSGLWWFLSRRSTEQDQSGDPALSRRLQAASAPGMMALAVTTTLAAFDWLMSLDWRWYSTIYGVYFWAGSIVGSLATLILAVLALRQIGWLTRTVTVEHLHDMGKLLLGFTVFWAYIAFSQYFLIWYANLPEETGWFLARRVGGWNVVSYALVVGHFAVPFALLLPWANKRNPASLGFVAAWLLAFHFLDLYWQVMPTLNPERARPHLLDVTTLVAVAAGALALLVRSSLGRPLVPVGDPRLPESLAFRNV
jgi:hypothetical protein